MRRWLQGQLVKIPMPPTVLEELLRCQKITANIARKRQEGLITKMLRGLEEDEVMPIQVRR